MKLLAILSDRAIQFVEDTRGSGDVRFRLEVRYQWHEATRDNGETYTLRAVQWGQACVSPTIARSRWLQLLAEMQWTEVEVFEIQSAPFARFEHLPTAVDRMRQAESSLRNGDWNGVLAHCRAAIEAAVRSHARSDDLNLKSASDLMFTEAVPEDAGKRNALNDLVRALSAYSHFGRHESFPAMSITRDEAEFVYTTTLSLFSFLGRRLSKNETHTDNT